jgi:transcriptional regulator with XRE-family HTH domain
MRLLRAARKRHGLTLRELAELTGLSMPYLSGLENGRKLNPRPRTKRDLARALNYDVDELFPPNGRTTNEELREWVRALAVKGRES